MSYDGMGQCRDLLSSNYAASCRMTPETSSHEDTFMLQETSASWSQLFGPYFLWIAAREYRSKPEVLEFSIYHYTPFADVSIAPGLRSPPFEGILFFSAINQSRQQKQKHLLNPTVGTTDASGGSWCIHFHFFERELHYG